jgi:hypothetical protein
LGALFRQRRTAPAQNFFWSRPFPGAKKNHFYFPLGVKKYAVNYIHCCGFNSFGRRKPKNTGTTTKAQKETLFSKKTALTPNISEPHRQPLGALSPSVSYGHGRIKFHRKRSQNA